MIRIEIWGVFYHSYKKEPPPKIVLLIISAPVL